MAADLPTVWAAHRAGEVDAEQLRVIDRVARRVTEARTLTAIDEQAVAAARTRSPKQLGAWLLRLVVRMEPLAFEARHRRALAERRVTIVQGVDGIGYVTGEVSAADAAAIEATLAATARTLGADDPRTEQQRRSDLFADLLLGRLQLVDDEPAPGLRACSKGRSLSLSKGPTDRGSRARRASGPAPCPEPVEGPTRPALVEGPETDGDGGEWLEVEDIDPDTGELLGTRFQRLDADGEPVGDPVPTCRQHSRRRGPHRRSGAAPDSCGSG